MKFMSKIQITCETQDAQIYYSTDGSYPSNLYSEPFELSEEATIKAVGKKDSYQDSDFAEGNYFLIFLEHIGNYKPASLNQTIAKEGDTIKMLYYKGGLSEPDLSAINLSTNQPIQISKRVDNDENYPDYFYKTFIMPASNVKVTSNTSRN